MSAGRGRPVLGMIEQGLQSLVTLSVTVVTARLASVQEFAAVSMGLAIFYFALTVNRSLTTGPLVVLVGGDGHRVGAELPGVRQLAGLGSAGIGVAVIATQFYSHDWHLSVALVMATVPQVWLDTERYSLIAAGRIESAVRLALVYLSVSLTGIVGLGLIGHLSITTVLVLWGGTAGGTALMFVWLSSEHAIFPVSIAFVGYLSRARVVAASLTLEAIAVAGAPQLIVIALGIWSTRSEVAGFRLVTALALGPLTTMLMGILPQIHLAIRDWIRRDGEPLIKRVLAITLVLAAVTYLNAAVVAALPETFLVQIFGDTTEPALAMLWPAAHVTAAAGASTVCWMYGRYVYGVRETMIMRIATMAISLIVFCIGLALQPTGMGPYLLYSILMLTVPTVLIAKSPQRGRLLGLTGKL